MRSDLSLPVALAATALALLVAVVTACAGLAPPLTPAQVLAAFIALTQAPDRTMHMHWAGTYQMGDLGAVSTPIDGTFDFAGEDYAGTISTQLSTDPNGRPGQSTEVEIAVVGGQGYQRSPGSGSGGWEKTTDQPQTIDPLRGLTEADIEYVGLATVASRELHHLRVKDVSTLVGTIFGGLNGRLPGGAVSFDNENSAFDIYVDATAHPVSASLDLATGASPGEFGVISLTAEYEFSNWGAEIYIVPPP